MKHLSHVTRNGQEELHQRIQCPVSPNPEHKKIKDKAGYPKLMQCLSLQSIFYLGIFLTKYTRRTAIMISDPQPSLICGLVK